MKPEDMKVLVIGAYVWGKGNTLTEALKNMRKNGKSSKYIAYIVHPDSWVDGMGAISYPSGYAPKEIHRVGIPQNSSEARSHDPH